MEQPEYEVLALRYATHKARLAGQNFIFPDAYDMPMPMDYFIWAISGNGRTIVVDTGFGPAVAARRRRTLLRHPAEALANAGIDAASVPDVIVTHLHHDHGGCLDAFPAATFHLQDAEMTFATGRCMCHSVFRMPMEVDDVVAAVRHVYAGRVRFHDGTGTIAPGVTVHLVGGHSGGLQVVRVRTARGWVVLASDATHYYANIRNRNPFPLVVDVAKMLEGFRTCEELADSPDHVVPGHDPEVLRCYKALPGQPDIVQLHLPPSG